MARYSPKDNKVYFGWEGDLKKIQGSVEGEAVFSDVDFMVNLESIDLDTIKPKTTREQKWFLGNTTRVNSYTYDTQFVPGSGSFGAQFKHGHIVDAVCGGCVSTQTNSGYQEFGLRDKTMLDLTGLSVTTTYSITINIDAGGPEEITIDTTAETLDYENIIDLLNEAIDTDTGANYDAYFSLVDGDLRCTSYATGSSSVALTDGSTGTNLLTVGLLTGFTALETAVAGQSYDTVNLSGGGVRSSFFMRFEHSTSHMKDLLGCLGVEIALDASENNFVTYTMNMLSAKMYPDGNATTLSAGDTSTMDDIERAPFHWKHVHTSLSLDGGSSIYTAVNRNQVESVNTTIRNLTEYKFGAQSTGGNYWANWFKEMKFETEASMTLYPEDEAIWLLCPSETEYVNYATMGSVRYDGLASAFTVGLTVTGTDSGASGEIVYDYNIGDNGYLFLKNVSGSFESGEEITDSSTGDADVYNAMQDISILSMYNGVTSEGHGLSTQNYYITVNGVEYTIGCTSAELMSDLIADLDTATTGVCTWSAGSGNLRATMDLNTSAVILIEPGTTGDDLASNITGYVEILEAKRGYSVCDPKLEVIFKRASDDFIKVTLTNLVGMSITERLESIEAGVDPATINFSLAKSTAGTNVTINDPLNDNSYSNAY